MTLLLSLISLGVGIVFGYLLHSIFQEASSSQKNSNVKHPGRKGCHIPCYTVEREKQGSTCRAYGYGITCDCECHKKEGESAAWSAARSAVWFAEFAARSAARSAAESKWQEKTLQKIINEQHSNNKEEKL